MVLVNGTILKRHVDQIIKSRDKHVMYSVLAHTSSVDSEVADPENESNSELPDQNIMSEEVTNPSDSRDSAVTPGTEELVTS